MRKQQDLSHIRSISPWLTLEEAAAYLKMSVTSFRKIASQIGGRLLECFNRELRFYIPDIDAWVLKHSKLA